MNEVVMNSYESFNWQFHLELNELYTGKGHTSIVKTNIVHSRYQMRGHRCNPRNIPLKLCKTRRLQTSFLQ